MRSWIVLLLITPAFIGCIGSDDADPLEQAGLAGSPAGEAIAAYRPGGESVPLDALDTIGETVTELTGFGGAEPTMGITESGTIVATAGDHLIRSQDEGASWESVYQIGLEQDEGLPTDSVYRSWDPWVHVDEITDTIYMDPMFPPLACTELSWSTDDGDSWMTNPAVCHPPPMDHQKLFTALPGPEASPQAGVLHATVLYQCYNQLLATECAVSYDGGLSWPVTQPVADQLQGPCGGINGPGAGSPDGVAVVPITSGCDELTIAYTLDSGLSWELMETPDGPGLSSIDPELMFDEEGNLYAIWRGDDQAMYLARTPDLGDTWAGPWKISPPGVQTTMFHALSTGAPGQVGMAFLGTKDTPDGPNGAPEGTLWHLYVVTTSDGLASAPTFTSYQVTPDDDPAQVGRICTGGIGCDGGRNLLEFIDTAIHPDGSLHVIYTDGCTEECQDGPDGVGQSSARDVAWAQLSGVNLLDAPATS